MTAVSLAQSELIDRLRVRHAERDTIATERAALDARDTELQREITELLASLQELTASGAVAPVPLVFDSDGKTIRWDGGSVKLGKIPRQFVKALYFAKKQRLTMNRIENRVWQKLKNKKGTSHRTICKTFYNLCDELKKTQFPYEILNVKNKKKTVSHTDLLTQKVREIVVEPEVMGFILRVKPVFSIFSQG